MSSIDLSEIGYALFIFYAYMVIPIFFVPTSVIFFVRGYHKTYKLLFWITFIPAFILFLNLLYIWHSFNSNNTYLPESVSLSFVVKIIYFLAFLIPIIVGYWIHLCSKHKYSDYWIFGIIMSLPILWLLWLLGMY